MAPNPNNAADLERLDFGAEDALVEAYARPRHAGRVYRPRRFQGLACDSLLLVAFTHGWIMSSNQESALRAVPWLHDFFPTCSLL